MVFNSPAKPLTRAQVSRLHPSSTSQPAPPNDAPSPTQKQAQAQEKPPPALLAGAHIAELKAIWAATRQIPTLSSRRAWAHARHVDPRKVISWFSRKKAAAKKAGLAVSEDSYDLPVGAPPDLGVEDGPRRGSVGPPQARGKRRKIAAVACSEDGSRGASPALTLGGSPYDPATPSGSSDTAVASPTFDIAAHPQQRAYSRAYSRSFDVPTDLFLDPTLHAEEIGDIPLLNAKIKTPVLLTDAMTGDPIALPSLIRASSTFSNRSDQPVEEHPNKDDPQDNSSSRPASCACVLCAPLGSKSSPEQIDQLYLTHALTVADLSMLYDSPPGSASVLSFQRALSPLAEVNLDSLTPQAILPTSPPRSELSAIPFLYPSPKLMLPVPLRCDPTPHGSPFDESYIPFVKVHLGDDSYDFLPDIQCPT